MTENTNDFTPTNEDLMNGAAHLMGELEACKAAGREVMEHATAYREMLMLIHVALRQKEETGAEMTSTERRIREIVGSPEVTRAGAEDGE